MGGLFDMRLLIIPYQYQQEIYLIDFICIFVQIVKGNFMSKLYLYYLEIHTEGGYSYDGYCLSDKNLSEEDIKSDETGCKIEAFREMIKTNATFYWFNGGISDLKIRNKIPCAFNYNKYIPDNLYKSLTWFDRAMKSIDNTFVSQGELKQLLKEIKVIDFYRDAVNSQREEKETLAISVKTNYLTSANQVFRYCEIILEEIIKIVSSNSISCFDRNIISVLTQKEIEHAKIETLSDFLALVRDLNSNQLVSLKSGDNLCTKDLHNNILYYAERIVFEIGHIFYELIKRPYFILNEEEDVQVYDSNESFEKILLNFKKILIKEKEYMKIQQRDIDLTLEDIKNEKKTKAVFEEDDKEKIFQELCPLLKNKKEAKNILDKMDEYHKISTSYKFPKRKLGVLIYILFCCKCFNPKLSFEAFKQRVCAYYGKDNISIKPNKIHNEAIAEYNNHDYMYKNWGIKLQDLD